MKFLKDILTEDDNQTYCAARVCGILTVIGFTAVALLRAFDRSSQIDFSQLGIGFGAVLTGSGALIGAKALTQRKES